MSSYSSKRAGSSWPSETGTDRADEEEGVMCTKVLKEQTNHSIFIQMSSEKMEKETDLVHVDERV